MKALTMLTFCSLSFLQKWKQSKWWLFTWHINGKHGKSHTVWQSRPKCLCTESEFEIHTPKKKARQQQRQPKKLAFVVKSNRSDFFFFENISCPENWKWKLIVYTNIWFKWKCHYGTKEHFIKLDFFSWISICQTPDRMCFFFIYPQKG